jgi:hypothetical protein
MASFVPAGEFAREIAASREHDPILDSAMEFVQAKLAELDV